MQNGGGWRERLLIRLVGWVLVFGTVVAVASIVSVVFGAAGRAGSPLFIGMLSAFFLLVPVRFLRLPYVWRAISFVGVLIVLGLLSLANFGYVPGPVLICTLATMSSGVFIGRRALAAALFITAVGFVSIGYLATTDYIEIIGVLDGALRSEWIRAAVAYAFTGGCLAIVVYLVVDMVERQEAALEQSKRLEAIGQLASGVSHDFNNYLQVVLTWTQMLRSNQDQAALNEGLDRIQAATEHAADLTRQLLAIGRKDVRKPEWLSISDHVAEAATSVLRMLPADIELKTEIEPVPLVRCDPTQLRQILLNLVINARDALVAGGTVTVSVAAATRESIAAPRVGIDHDYFVRLTVADNGPGIPEHIKAHIFEPFFTTKGRLGTGMGLAIVYGAVRANNGLLRMVTAPGKGTAFNIYFPVTTAQTATARKKDEQGPRAVAGSHEGTTILCAEDDPAIRATVGAFLADCGMRVEQAPDGDSALQQLKNGLKADVLLIDGVMPGAPTSDVIEEFLKRNPDGQVLICSGYVEEELVRRGLDEGRYRFLPKPFTLATLRDQIEDMLRISDPRA